MPHSASGRAALLAAVLIAAAAGTPAFRQHIVTGLALIERYPYGEVALSRALTVEHHGVALGAQRAGDLFHRLTRTWAAGGGARSSRATAEADVEGASPSIVTGGLQLTGGIR